MDLEYEIEPNYDVMSGYNFNELSEFVPDKFKVNRLDKNNKLIPTVPQ